VAVEVVGRDQAFQGDEDSLVEGAQFWGTQQGRRS
jgi:hypothetical protein